MHTIYGLLQAERGCVDLDHIRRLATALSGRETMPGQYWHADWLGLGFCDYQPVSASTVRPDMLARRHECVVASAGYITNRPELVAALEQQRDGGDIGDSELLLRAYERWGLDCPGHILGDIVYAIADGRSKTLLLARAPFAERTLFYQSSPKGLAFAGRPKGLFALPWVRREIEPERVADYLISAPPSAGQSFYRDVRRLESGTHLIATPSAHRIVRHWQPVIGERLHLNSDAAYVEAYTELMARVVSDHCRSTGGVGIMQSGGLDSSTIAVFAADELRRQGKRLAAFTGAPPRGSDPRVPPGSIADETPQVHALAERIGIMDVHEIRTEPAYFLSGIKNYFEDFEAPMRSASGRIWVEQLFAEAQSRGVDCLLTGGGGNLSISWDGSDLLAQQLKRGAWLPAWREARALQEARGTGRPAWRAFLAEGWMPLMPDPLWRLLEAVRRRQATRLSADQPWKAYSAIHPDFAREARLKERALDKQHDLSYRRPGADSRYTRYRALAFMSEMASELAGGFHVRYGIGMRGVPFDPRLINFCLSIPEEQCLRNGEPRWLIRRAMAGRLPEQILDVRRRGFPTANWLEQLRATRLRVMEELRSLRSSASAVTMIDLDRLEKLVAALEHVRDDPKDLERLSLQYRTVLEIGVMVGRFVQWVESGE